MYNKDVFKSFIIILMLVVKFKKKCKVRNFFVYFKFEMVIN